MKRLFHAFLKYAIGGIVFKILYRVEIEGLENIPNEGKAILASNHASYLDPMALFCISPRPFYSVAAKFLFGFWWLGWVLKSTNCISTDKASKECVSILNNGSVLLIFPQGGCVRRGNEVIPHPHKGVAVFALKTGAPVIPISIKGTFEAWPVTRIFPRFFKKIKIRVGKPMVFQVHTEEIIPANALDETLNRIINSINELWK